MTKLAFVLENGRELQVPLASELPLGRLVEMTAAVRDAEREHQERLKSLGLISADHDRVSTELQRVTSRHQQIAAAVYRLQKMEADLRQELHALASRKEQALNALQDLTGRRAVEQTQLQSLEDKTAAERELLARMSDSAEAAQAELDTARARLEEANQQREQIHAGLALRTQELAEAQARIAEACERHAQMSHEREALTRTCEDLVLSRDCLQQIQSELESEIARLKSDEQQACQATAKAAEAQQEASRLLQETEERLQTSRGESRDLDERIAAARRALDDLGAFQADLAPVVAAQQEKQAQMQATIRHLEDLYGSRQSALHATGADLTKAERELTVAQRALEKVREDLAERESQLRARQDELDGRCHEIADRESQLNRLTEVIASQRVIEHEAELRLTALSLQIQGCQQQIVQDEKQRDAAQGELTTLTTKVAAVRLELVELEETLRATIDRATVASIHLETTLIEEKRAARMLADTKQELATAQNSFADVSPRLDLTLQQLMESSTLLDATREEHAQLAQELKAGREALEVQQRVRDAVVEEKQGVENTLRSLHEQERDAKARVEALTAAEKSQRERYDELRSLVEAVDKERAAQREAHEQRLGITLQELREAESRLEALQAWNERMNECQARLAGLSADSLEARNIRNDIEVSMAGFRHLLSKNARAVMPPPLPQRARAVADGPWSPGASHPGLTTLRARSHSPSGAALKEQDKTLEDKIRQNEARLELLESRLKRGEMEERNQREKIATLKQQLVTMSEQLSARAHAVC